MGHSAVWNSHPKNFGPGSRTWYASLLLSFSLSFRRSVTGFFLDLFVRLMMSLLDAKFRGSFGEPGILGGS
jgi:hypothetical protein